MKHVICLDLETAIIRPGLCAPPPSVCSIYDPESGVELFGTHDMLEPVAKALTHRTIVGHNIAYDMLVLFEWLPQLRPLVFQAYEQDRILDTSLCERILEISRGDMRGQLSLDKLCARYGLNHGSKHDVDESQQEIRLGFGKHWGADLSGLTDAERAYCADDVVLCWQLFQRQMGKQIVAIGDLGKLGRTAFALGAVSAFGLRADPDITVRLQTQAQERVDALSAVAIERGFMRREKDRNVRTKLAYQQAVAKAYGINTRRGDGRNANTLYPVNDEAWYERLYAMGLLTDTGAISTGKGVLRESGDEMLISLADLQEWQAVINKDLPIFKSGIFHTRFGFANTLRTTSSGPNIQNFRRKAGVRECITPHWGCFVASDYSGLELATVAELTARYTGRTGMAKKVSEGHDFHADVGARILGISLQQMQKRLALGDKEAKAARSAAKPLNFGLLGKMSNPATFQCYARDGYGVRLTIDRASELMQIWWDTQHDQMAYLRHIDTFRDGDLYAVPIPNTSIVRRGCTGCAAANTGFQSLGMMVAGSGLWLIVKGQLLGHCPGRACAFVHDEILTDCKPEDRDEVMAYHNEAMLAAAETEAPQVKMRVEHQAFTRWTKAFPEGWQHLDSSGRLNLYEVAA